MAILNVVSTVSRTGLQSAWMAWEGVFDQFIRMSSASVTNYGICKLVLRQHHGKSIVCEQGHVIDAGDWIGELHLDNRKVMELSRSIGPDRTGLQIARMLRQSLQLMCLDMIRKPELQKVRALTGMTLLHRGIIHGLGFEQRPMESKWQRIWMTYYLRLLMRVLHPNGQQRMKHSTSKLVPKILIMPRELLLKRYGGES